MNILGTMENMQMMPVEMVAIIWVSVKILIKKYHFHTFLQKLHLGDFPGNNEIIKTHFSPFNPSQSLQTHANFLVDMVTILCPSPGSLQICQVPRTVTTANEDGDLLMSNVFNRSNHHFLCQQLLAHGAVLWNPEGCNLQSSDSTFPLRIAPPLHPQHVLVNHHLDHTTTAITSPIPWLQPKYDCSTSGLLDA